MMAQLEVEVLIRKGLSAQFITKTFSVGFDDLPEETTKDEIEMMARSEVETHLYGSEDYRRYGKNWKIIQYHYT